MLYSFVYYTKKQPIMKQFIFSLLAVSIIMTACEGPAPAPEPKENHIGIKKENGEDFVIEYEMDTVRNVKEGYYKIIMNNGKVAFEQQYKNDTLVGTEKEYHANGELKSEFLVANGQYNGVFKYYFEDGKIYQEGVNVNGQIEGELETYYPNGQLKETVMMSKSIEEGPFIEYFDNGKTKTKGTYKNGKEHCLLEMYKEDASGEVEFKKICRDGQCCTFWSLKDGDTEPTNDLCKEVLETMKTECGIEELQ
jgi:antitoxin component YwqK of YwqJK toxin-antitoxin module